MSKNQAFQQFINHKSNAAKKEQFKQEKRLAKKERAAAIEKRFEEKRNKTALPTPQPHSRPAKTGASRQPQPKNIQADKIDQRTGGGTQKKPVPTTQATTHPQESKPALQKPANRQHPPDLMPLNKYVAHSGICSRRDAADLIRRGEVKVNDLLVTEPGTKVSPADSITVKGKKITPSKNHVYILLNKPKDYITTLEDPEGRKTVLDLVKRATDERVYPVGRLDRNTSGVLLITNDGDLAQTLSHPKNLIRKIYEVRLDRALTKTDLEKLAQGLQLEDGFIVPDAIGFTDPKDKTILGIEIHSGRNRIVRRMFEFLGYDVRGLDRVSYAGLTKKNVQRGKWRFLNEKEIRILKHFNPQTKKDKIKKPSKTAAGKPVAKPYGPGNGK